MKDAKIKTICFTQSFYKLLLSRPLMAFNFQLMPGKMARRFKDVPDGMLISQVCFHLYLTPQAIHKTLIFSHKVDFE